MHVRARRQSANLAESADLVNNLISDRHDVNSMWEPYRGILVLPRSESVLVGRDAHTLGVFSDCLGHIFMINQVELLDVDRWLTVGLLLLLVNRLDNFQCFVAVQVGVVDNLTVGSQELDCLEELARVVLKSELEVSFIFAVY